MSEVGSAEHKLQELLSRTEKTKAKEVEQMQQELKTARLNKLEETKLNLWKKFVENL